MGNGIVGGKWTKMAMRNAYIIVTIQLLNFFLTFLKNLKYVEDRR
jgi:hypothetical protein